MADETDLDTTPVRDAGPDRFVPIESVSPNDTPEVLERKVEAVVRQLGDEVIKYALATDDLEVLTDRDALMARVGERIRFQAEKGAPGDFVDRVEQSIADALVSQADFLGVKAAAARLGAVFGLGQAFAIFADFAITALSGQLSAADPVSLQTGQLTHEETDLHLDGAGMDFSFTRTYASQAFHRGPLGIGWDHAYNLWLRVEPGEQRIVRSNGALREDVYRRHQAHDYWVPPDGEDGVIVAEPGGFVWRAPDGLRCTYLPDPTEPFVHQVTRIEDRFGNYLAFTHVDRMLRVVEVNHPRRTVELGYDPLGRVTEVRDFTGRTWRYSYDDLGDMVGVTTPATADHPGGLTTCYDYDTAFRTGDLRHNLLRITDAAGRVYLENEYGDAPGSLAFDRVVRQRQGSGETTFEYEDVVSDLPGDLADAERPARQTLVTHRGGQEVRYVFNRFGNLVLREECGVIDGIQRLLRSHYRSNADGNLLASLTPEGVMTQYRYGREEFLRLNPGLDETTVLEDPALTVGERQGFGRLLTTVRRARTFTLQDLDLSRTVWGDMFPDVLAGTDSDDVIVKYTYEPAYGQVLTQSNPRFTASADPVRQDVATGEHERYAETLTRYEYAGPPGDSNLHLTAIVRPAPTFPDGTRGSPLVDRFVNADGTPGYDDRGRRVRSVDARGTVTKLTYVAEDLGDTRTGHLSQTLVDPGGLALRTRFEVDDLGRVVATIHPRAEQEGGGFTSRTLFNALDQVVESVGPAPFAHRTRRHYGCSGELVRVERDLRDADGVPEHGGLVVRSFEHDEELHVVTERVGGVDPAPSLVTRHRYDSAGRLRTTILPNGTRVGYAYDGRGLPLTQTLGGGGEHASRSRIAYDGDGRARRGIDARGAVTGYRLDSFGRMIAQIDALAHVTRTSYDKNDNVTCVRYFERRDDGYHLLARSESTYDELDRLVSTGFNLFEGDLGPVAASDLAGAHLASPGPGRLLQSRQFHDAGGEVTRHIDALGRETHREVDAIGRLVATSDPLGHRTESHLDAHGNAVRVDVVEGVRDSSGTLTGQRVFSTVSAYDELDRLVGYTDPLGNRTRYGHDSRGNPVLRVDPLGHTVRLRFDVLGRRVATVHERAAGDLTTTYEHDANGNLTAVVDPLGHRTEQHFDDLNRRVAVVHADGSLTRFEWDAGGNLTRTVDAKGTERLLTTDAKNRVASVEVHLADGEGASFEAYEHDALDRCLRAGNDFATCEYGYNSLGWAIEETVTYATAATPPAPLTIRREFNDAGMVIAVEYPWGRRLDLDRDPMDRLLAVRHSTTGAEHPGSASPAPYDVARMAYAGSQRASCERPNGTTTAYSYDAAGRLIEIAHDGAAGELLRLQYAHDSSGTVRMRNDITEGSTSAELLDYDAVYRLVRQTTQPRAPFAPADFAPPSQPEPTVPDRQRDIDALFEAVAAGPPTFEYDDHGNREVERRAGQALAFEVNDLDQYESRAGTPLGYDTNGNLVDDGRLRYAYDSQDRLTRVEDAQTGATLARYQHDARGRRVLEVESGRATHLLWDAANLAAEYRDGRPVAAYVFDDDVDRPLEVATDGTQACYHCDALGSVRALTDPSGAPVATYRYAPFGALLETTGGFANPLRFHAHRRSEVSRTYDFRARQYNPDLGRFHQRDPAGMVESTNLYLFARNSPLGATDPWGTESRSEVVSDPIAEYFAHYREALDRRAGRYPQDKNYQQAFEMYGLVLDEIEESARSGRPVDLNGLWREGQRFNWDWENRAWMYLCSKCYENPSFADVGPFGARTVAGIDTVAVFNAAISNAQPNPSLVTRVLQEATKVALVFGPGLAGGPVRATMPGAITRTAGRAGLTAERALVNSASVAESRAALAAEAVGGERVWLVGPGGASTTRGIRISGNRVSYDTLAPAASTTVRQDMGAIGNMLGMRGPSSGFFRQGTWWSGTHGTPHGAFGGQHLEYRFIRTDRQIGQYYNWEARSVANYSEPTILTSGLERPTVFAWCYSSSCFVRPPLPP